MITSTQTLALSGLMNGEGFAVNQAMASEFATFNNQAIVSNINLLYTPATGPNTISNVAGLYNSILRLPKWVTGRNANVSISDSIHSNANIFIGSGISGVSNLITNFGKAVSYCGTALDWNASIYSFSDQNFKDLGLENTNYTDIASNGLTGYFYRLKNSPVDMRSALRDLASTIIRLGKSFDPTNLQVAFGPAAFIIQLRNYNLADFEFLNQRLRENSIITDDDIRNTNPEILRGLLKNITGIGQINRVVDTFEIVLIDGQIVTSFDDFVNAYFMLPNTIQILCPTGSMQDLNETLGELGGSFPTSIALGNFIGSIEVPEFDLLNNLENPVPTSYITSLEANIGRGNITVDSITESVGTGVLNNPTVLDILGSAAGHKHYVNFKTINSVFSEISHLDEVKTLSANLYALYQADIAMSPTTTLLTFANNAIDSFLTMTSQFSAANVKANSAIVSTLIQQIRETSLQNLSNVNIINPVAEDPLSTVMSFVNSLPTYAEDRNNLGTSTLINGIGNSLVVSGQAIQATLIEARNRIRKTQLSIRDTISVDPNNTIKNVQETNRSTLTDQQKENIIAEAEASGKNALNEIRNAEILGYDNNYYVQKGYPPA